jgi:hypothetical protein
VSAREGRTVAELLDDSHGLAREALLDMSADRAPGMVRGWPQLMQSAAELSEVLPADPTASANADPIAVLAAMGRAVGRGLAAGHWPGRGPRDEAWEQIASNFMQARRLLQEQPVAPEAESTNGQIGRTTANTQILQALYVAAHATAVALTGYQRDLQHRLEVGARRRQPFVERPTALEVESAKGMIAGSTPSSSSLPVQWRRGGSPQLANRQPVGTGQPPPASALRWPPGRSKRTGHSPATRTRPIWSGSPACRR